MKNECDVIQDLLFSYNDGILSNTSKELIEEHLKKCAKCKSVLEEINDENVLNENIDEIDFLKTIRNKINMRNILIILGVIILIILILFNIVVFKNYNDISSTMEIYLEDTITEKELNSIKNKLLEVGRNIEISYISKENALHMMKNKLGDNAYLLEGYTNTVENPLPAYFELKTDTDIEIMVESIKNLKGIKRIVTHLNYNPYILFFENVFYK